MTSDSGTNSKVNLEFITLSKLPSNGTSSANATWEEQSETSQTSLSPAATAGCHQYMNGDASKLSSSSGGMVYPSTSMEATLHASVEYSNGGTAVPLASNQSPTVTAEMDYQPALVTSTAVPPSQENCDIINNDDQQEHSSQLPSPASTIDNSIPQDQLKAMLQQQLEYYFSRENLANDTYLLSQMDSDQYVPIWTVANFNQIKKLTKDLNLIVEVLRDSPNVQVDEAGEKVRPNHKRCIVILREIPSSTPVEEIKALFKGENCPKFVSCEFAHNNSWYVTFESDEDAQKAYRYLREEVKTFQGKSIMARIKAKPITRASFLPKNGVRPVAETAVFSQQQRYASFQPAIPSVSYSSQQVPTVYAFPPFYPPNMLQTWAPTTSPAYYDIGTVFSFNGLAPQAAFKPLNGTGRSNFPLLRSRNQKIHSRNQGSFERLDTRTSNHGYSSATSNGFGSTQKSVGKPSSLDEGYSKRDTVTSGSNVLTIPTSPEIPATGEMQNLSNPNLSSEKREDMTTQTSSPMLYKQSEVQTNLTTPRSRHRRRKKEEENRSEVSSTKSTNSTKESRIPPLPKFDLEAAAFPPLPGTQDAGSLDSEAFENRLSDVVRGTVKPLTRDSKTQTSAPLSPVASPGVKENSNLTNGDALNSVFTPPPSPSSSLAMKVTTADKATRTDEYLNESKEQEYQTPLPLATSSYHASSESAKSSVVMPVTLMPKASQISTRVSTSTSTSTSTTATTNCNTTPANSISSQYDKTKKLSYAQMAQRAKEKVEKEQRERQDAQERDRKQRERDSSNMLTTSNNTKSVEDGKDSEGKSESNLEGCAASHAREGRNHRDHEGVIKGQRERFSIERDRYRRSNNSRTLKESTSDDRDRRREREPIARHMK